MERLLTRYRTVMYDGTNAQDIIDNFLNSPGNTLWQLISATSSLMQFEYIANAEAHSCQANRWIVMHGEEYVGVVTATNLSETYERYADIATLLTPSVVLAQGIEQVPPLALNASDDIDVTISPGFADDNYVVATPIVLSSLTVGSTLVVDDYEILSSDQVRVTVRNTGVISVGGTLLVTALKVVPATPA